MGRQTNNRSNKKYFYTIGKKYCEKYQYDYSLIGKLKDEAKYGF